jgi:hypothetical protein
MLTLFFGLLVIKDSNSVGLQAVASDPSISVFTDDSLLYNFTHLYRYYLGSWGLDWSLGWKHEPELEGWISYAQGLVALTILFTFIRISKLRGHLILLFN